MHLIFIALIVLALLYAPMFWVKRVMNRYSQPAERYPSSGADLARYLLDARGLQEVTVESTEAGDHYDPIEKVVRLGADHFDGRSLTAVTIAAHEVGHAIQDQEAYAPLRARTRLVKLAQPIERVGAGILMTAPLVGLVTRAPSITGLMLAGGLLTLGSATLIHMITLPTEFDASFNRAVPMLEDRSVLREGDLVHARKILLAAAMTYVAASLMSLLNIGRWWALLRR